MDRVSHAASLRAPDRSKPMASVARPLAIDRLQQAAERRPDSTFLAHRGPDQAGRGLTCAEAWERAGAIASWLIAQGFGPRSAPVAILSDDSLEAALLLYGALRSGVPVASLSPEYSLSGDFTRFDQALDNVEPGLVFAQDPAAYGAALDRAQARGVRIVTADGERGLAFAALATCSVDASVSERRLHITADTPARIQFTSDSTGFLESVPSTHGNLADPADLELIVAGGNA
jgi:feruloyl-CoA synthase